MQHGYPSVYNVSGGYTTYKHAMMEKYGTEEYDLFQAIDDDGTVSHQS